MRIVMLLMLNGCFAGYPVDYFSKISQCIENHPQYQDICLAVRKKTKGYPYDIDFEHEYQKLLKERSK